MSSTVQTVLSDVGWDMSYTNPELNANNKALVEEVYKAKKEFMEQDNKVKKTEESLELMTEHLKGAKQDWKYSDDLWRAKESEVELEKHLEALAERESGRLGQQTVNAQKDLWSFMEKKESTETNMVKTKKKLEEFKHQMTWDQQTLEEFLEESTRREEDTMAIIKYAQQDEQKIKSLTLAIEKKSVEAGEKRKALEKELTETASAQVGLDRTAENLQQVHLETQELIHQWGSSIKQIKQQESELQRRALQLAQANQKIRENEAGVSERTHLLDMQKDDNKELERKIAAAKKQSAKLLQDVKEQEANFIRLRDELNDCKNTLNRWSSDLKSLMSTISRRKEELKKNNEKLKDARVHKAALEEKLEVLTRTVLSEEERAAQMEQFLEETEQVLQELGVLQQNLMEELLRHSQQLQLVKAKEKDCTVQVFRSKFTISGLESQLRKLEMELIKHQGTMNIQDTEITKLNRELDRLQGDNHSEERKMLDLKIAELRDNLVGKKTTEMMLTNALRECEDGIRYLKKEMEKSEAQTNDLNDGVKHLELLCEGSEKELKSVCLRKQDNMVEQKITLMEVKRVRDLLYSKADNVLSLEKRKIELQKEMDEREEDIDVYIKILSQQLKCIELEKQRLSAELNEKLIQIDKMKSHFEVILFQVALPEGEEEKSQIYYIIKAAQEKEELKQKEDDLDAKVRKMELETRALENTILLISSGSNSLHSFLGKDNDSTSEFLEELQLEEELTASETMLRDKEQEAEDLQQNLKDLNSILETLLQEEPAEKETLRYKLELTGKLSKDMASLQEKISRATNQCSKLTKEIRSAKKTKTQTLEEQDIQLKELQDFNKNINKMLIEAMEDSSELGSVLEKYLLQASLPRPSPPPASSSQRSSRTSSSHSAASHRSPVSSAGSSPKGSALSSPQQKTLSLDLDLTCASPPLTSSRAFSRKSKH